MTIDGITFTVKKCEGDELINFWKDHGSHFEMCIGRNKKFQERKLKKGGKSNNNIIKNPVTLGDETYYDIAKIKNRARTILNTTKDGEKVSGIDHQFLLDVLKHHRNAEEKGKDLSHFTTGKPHDYDYNRCFFIVRGDETKEDFSIHKCIEKNSK